MIVDAVDAAAFGSCVAMVVGWNVLVSESYSTIVLAVDSDHATLSSYWIKRLL